MVVSRDRTKPIVPVGNGNASPTSGATTTATATRILVPDVDEEQSLLSLSTPDASVESEHIRHTKGQHESSTLFSIPVLMYMCLFFFAMIAHELALEAATHEFGHVDALASAVTCFQFGSCLVFPLLAAGRPGCRRFPRTFRQILPYVRLSVLVFGASGLATHAVRYVTYPTKVVFKSAKLIPTMIVATLWQGQRYTGMEYVAALWVCVGAAGFSYNSGNNPHGTETNDTIQSTPGLLLLSVSIVCDAIVPNYQKALLNGGLSANQLMINVNAVGLAALGTYMALTGELRSVAETATEHPWLLLYLTCVGLGLATAVWAYTKLIQATSSVVAVGVSTLRKVATILLSYIFFPKRLLTIHVVSGCLVLAGIILSFVAKDKLRTPRGN
jgi:drug/metabolite transporter (DMT)-like permease